MATQIHKQSAPKAPVAVKIETSNGNEIIIDDCFLQYLEMISKILGITNYEEFSKMTEGDRLSSIREIQINKIIC